MNNGQKSLSINETFIIEGENDGTMSACTGFFTNALVSCTGNTQILLGTNIIQTNSPFSATTFYGDGSNLTGISTQDTFVTGGTYDQNSGVATFTNNTGGTFSLTGFYTGATDIYVTAVTFSNNLLTLDRNDGVSFGVTINDFVSLNVNGPISGITYYGDGSNLTGISTQDTVVTGGTYYDGVTTFTNNTGGTFTINGPSNYDAGVIFGAENWGDNGDGSIDLPEIKVALYDNPNNLELLKIYTVASGTTGVGGIPPLANDDTNYIIVEYNNGSPRYNVLDNDGTVTSSDVVLYMIVYRANNFVHTLEFGDMGAGLSNKLNTRLISTDRFARESGCALGLSGSTGIVTLSSGVVWNGPYRQIVTAVNSQDDVFFKSFHSGGTWTYVTTGDTINNSFYDNGTNLISATAGKYLVNWYFRGQEVNDHLYELISFGEYDTIQLAEASPEPNLPELITSHAFLVGRIIVEVSATTGITQSAFSTVFQPSGAPVLHNDLAGIQGGIAGEYYHLDSNKYNNLALTNTNNNFSVGQRFNAGLTATTISATTYQNLPLDIRVTGGTYSSITGIATYRNNTGGTFNVSGFFRPSDDIYVTSGSVDHGPSNAGDNLLTLTRSNLSDVNISNLVNISNTTKTVIDGLISDNKIIRGKTYKISNCDSGLYYNGTDRDDNPVYTTVYLMGLEGNKLSETGVGVFYTPKYGEFPIFENGVGYGEDQRVIWGGYIWICVNAGNYNSVDLFTLDPSGFKIIYPFNRSNDLNGEYNINYDDIIYDYDNDKIIYRNEQNTNIVSTTVENINYWINKFNYNPIKVFQWGNVYNVENRGIGNQRIINSYNENINYTGRFQKDFYFNDLSYQVNCNVSSDSYQELFYFDNGSYQDTVNFSRVGYQSNISLINSSYQIDISFGDGYQNNVILENNSYQSRITISNDSYQNNITLKNGSYLVRIDLIASTSFQENLNFDNNSYQELINFEEECYQLNLNFDNNSYQSFVELRNRGKKSQQEYIDFTNGSYQENIVIDSNIQQYFNFNNGYQTDMTITLGQSYINIENGSQINGLSESQDTITIKGYDLDWSSYTPLSPQTDLFFIHDLPSDTTSTLVGKKDNRLIEVSDLYYDGSKWVLNGNIIVGGLSATTISATTVLTNGLTANTISATTYQNLPSYNLSGLTDVNISGVTDNEILVYNSSTQEWENEPKQFSEVNDSRAWTLTNKNLLITGQEAVPTGIFFKSDGTRMFHIGSSADRVFQYDLSTPWDVTTAVLGPNLLVSGQDSVPQDLYFTPDGTIMFMVGSTNDRVNRYNLGTPWDISTAVFLNFYSTSAFSTSPVGLYFKPDGTQMYVVDTGSNILFNINLSTPWDLTTAVQTTSFLLTPFVTASQAISFNNSGTKIYVLDSNGDDVTQFNLSTPWDVTSASYETDSFTFLFEATPGGLYYNETAQVAYVVGSGADTVYGIDTSFGFKTDKSLELKQLFINDRFEVDAETLFRKTARFINPINGQSTISTTGSMSASGNLAITGTINIGSSTSAAIHSIIGGAVATGLKTVNIGTGGLNGSTTEINLGSTIGTTLNSEALQNNFKHNVNIDKSLKVEGNTISNPPTGAVVFEDTFTEAVTTALQSHTPDIGSGWTKSFAGTATNINVFGGTGDAGAAANATNLGFIYVTNDTFTNLDYEVTVNITSWISGDDPVWVIFRYLDNDNYYGFRVSLSSGDFRLYKRVGGITTLIIPSINTPVTNIAQDLTVRVIGNSISLFIGGVLYGTFYDNDLTAAGKCGIGMGNIGAGLSADDLSSVWKLNSFKVQEYVPSDLVIDSYINKGSLYLGATSGDTSAKVQIDSATQGFLPPRMTNAERTAITSPAVGLIVYCTDATEGLYIYKSGGWTFII